MTHQINASRVWALAGAVATTAYFAVGSVTIQTAAQTNVSGQSGKEVYDRVCAACHGRQGQGQLAPALVPFTRSYTDLLRIVRSGAGDMMMAFSSAEVSDADVKAIEEHLRGLGAGSGQASTSAPVAAATPAASAQTSTAAPAPAPNASPRASSGNRMVEWRYVGADQSNTRYSALALFAFDKRTGREVWHEQLPRRTSGTPMTYRSASGRQFVLVTTGSGSDQELIAFAFPAK